MAGHEATVNVIGNGVLALLDHPDQWRRLVADPGLDATAVEELIRYDPPLQLFERTAMRDTVVAGHPVPEGTKVAALLGAAAHDPQVFDRPDRAGRRSPSEPAPGLRRRACTTAWARRSPGSRWRRCSTRCAAACQA